MFLDSFARFLLVRRIRYGFYHWDAGQLRRHQSNRLKQIVRFASQHSPYYRQLLQRGWDGRFESLPVIQKRDYTEAFDEINTAGLRQEELIAFSIQEEREGRMGLYAGRYSVGLSSGTSGNKLVSVLSPFERWQYASLLFARSGIPDSIRHPRVLFALRVNNLAFMETTALGVDIVYVDYTHPPEELVQLINQKQLNVLAGPPSLLRMLGRLVDSIDHPVQALISYAEVLDDASRAELERIFQVPVTQIYQSTEGFLGSTCRCGRLHLNEDVVYVEALDTGDAMGQARRVVITDLYRQTQPFLRYGLNDVLEISDGPCECGSCFRLIERIHGRSDDVFQLRSADGSLRSFFPDYVTRSINQASPDILEFQAIQHAVDQIEIRLELKPGAGRAAIEQNILTNLAWWAGRVGASLGQVTFSDQLPERNPNSQKLIRVTRRF